MIEPWLPECQPTVAKVAIERRTMEKVWTIAVEHGAPIRDVRRAEISRRSDAASVVARKETP
jgi:hypothetical protein